MNSLFALSLLPYLVFLWFLSKTSETPKVALVGFYLLLVFVAVTIPAGLYSQTVLGTSLANIDWLHGGAEAFLTLSNLLVAIGFKLALDRDDRSSSQPDQTSQD